VKRKSALVTGSAGFIGRHMCDELERRGYDVIGVDLLPFDVPLVARDGVGNITWPTTSRIHIVQDMRNFIAERTTRDWYDLVVHCAYHVGGRAAIDATNAHFTRNVLLDAVLFDWAIRTQQPHVLYFSSSAVYPARYQTKDYVTYEVTPTQARLCEDDQIIRGIDFVPDCDADYGWAKYVGEQLAQNALENDVNVTVVRPFSGYGSDQPLDYPFPSFIKRARLREDPFTIWGNAQQVRDWIHIDDVVRGSLAVVEHDEQDLPTSLRPVNVCSGVGTALEELANLMCERVGYEPEITVNENAPMGVFHRVGNPTLFNDVYTPLVSLTEGIERALKETK
jgi:nucleoside-diphosphate-sugar epimerase